MWHKNSSATVLAHYGYTYDYASNVTTRTDTNGDVTTFGYDNSDQLTGESRGNGHGLGYALAFTYDHNHNRHTKVSGTGMSAVVDTYSYDAHDKLTGIAGGTNKSYGYDSNGNCTSVTVGTSVTSVSYDVENRVVGITYPSSSTNSFAYNGEDLRTQKVDSSGTRNYVCDGSSPASAVLKDGAAVYTPGLSERRGSTSKFLHSDALGSTRGITDSTQAVTDAMLYDAFGNVLSRTGTTPTPFGFVGASQYQTDSDSGLQLLGHRYYDPSIGRFLSSDPAKSGTNWYVYCDNNPLKRVDASGNYWDVVLANAATAAVDIAAIVTTGPIKPTLGLTGTVGTIITGYIDYLTYTSSLINTQCGRPNADDPYDEYWRRPGLYPDINPDPIHPTLPPPPVAPSEPGHVTSPIPLPPLPTPPPPTRNWTEGGAGPTISHTYDKNGNEIDGLTGGPMR